MVHGNSIYPSQRGLGTARLQTLLPKKEPKISDVWSLPCYTICMIVANGVPRPPRILRSQAQPVVLLMLLTHETAV